MTSRIDLRLTPIDATSGVAASAIETAVRRITGPIQTPIDLITATIQTLRCGIATGICRSI